MTTPIIVSHPIANAYPAMTDSEYVALKESIKKSGVRVPIVMYENMILDGRHRYMACKELGIECPTIEFDSDTCPVEYVRDINSNRRSLTASQRAAVAVALLPLIEIEAKKRQTGREEAKGKSSEIAADAVGVSPRMVERAKKVAKSAPDMIERVKSGEVTIGEAEAEIEKQDEPTTSNDIKDIIDNEDFSSIDKAIFDCIKRVKALSTTPHGAAVNTQQVVAALTDARNALKFARPHCACPVADNCDKTCKVCNGTGWTTKALAERVPADMKK